jgi:CheY-like chemotaxis protein
LDVIDSSDRFEVNLGIEDRINHKYVMKLNCLIVDDEPLARKGLEEYVKEVSFLHLAGTCENALKAAAYLKENSIDLMLLDIQMPKLSGIDFLKTLKNPPMVIFYYSVLGIRIRKLFAGCNRLPGETHSL